MLIWLQGGPGASSTGYGNFEELGPLDVNLQNRNYTWVNDYNVLFIDNPVGTGFSYVDLQSAYTDNNRQIAEDLVECIRGFYNKIPQFKKVSVYITAESYGGKMAAEFALLWFQVSILITNRNSDVYLLIHLCFMTRKYFFIVSGTKESNN